MSGKADRLSPPSLVTLAPRDTLSDLQQISARLLPDGATCFVKSENAVYRYLSSAAFGMAPGSGPGRWVVVGSSEFSQMYARGLDSTNVAGSYDCFLGNTTNQIELELPAKSGYVASVAFAAYESTTWIGGGSITMQLQLDSGSGYVTIAQQTFTSSDQGMQMFSPEQFAFVSTTPAKIRVRAVVNSPMTGAESVFVSGQFNLIFA